MGENGSRVNFFQYLLILVLRVYRAGISPLLAAVFGPLGLGCRFTPTCSQYALESVQRHGALRGAVLSVGRLCRCHPWGGCGEDPVPPTRTDRSAGILPARVNRSGPSKTAWPDEHLNNAQVEYLRSKPFHGS